MDIFYEMLHLQLQLLLLMMVGMLLRRIKLIDEKTQHMLSELLVNVVIPCNIVFSFVNSPEINKSTFTGNAITAVIISSFVQIAALLVGRSVFKKSTLARQKVLCYGLLVSNSSFVGIPVAESILGNIGVMYTSIYQIPIRVCMWTSGLKLFADMSKGERRKKLLLHPCIIAVAIGIVLFLLPVKIPKVVSDTIGSISKCCNCLSMFVLGSLLNKIDMKEIRNIETGAFCMLRLIVMPVVLFFFLKLIRINYHVVVIATIMTGMPAGTLTAILAEKYRQDSQYAAQLVFLSTVLSMITIPILCLLF